MRLMLDCTQLQVGGGIQVGLAVIDNALRTSGIDVRLASSAQLHAQLPDGQRQQVGDIAVVGDTLNANQWVRARQMRRLEARWQPDFAFTVFGPTLWRSRTPNLQGFARGLMLHPDIQSLGAGPVARLRYWVQNRIWFFCLRHHADHIVVETETVRRKLARAARISEERIAVVGNSYSPAFLRQCAALGSAPPEDGGFHIFVPAADYPHKNLDVVPEAAVHLARIGRADVTFVFTLDPHGPGWRRIAARAAALGVEAMCTTVGVVDNAAIAARYLKANAILCPSLIESSTAVFPEAFCAGRPVLASDRDYAHEACGAAALYFDPVDAASLAAAVARLVEEPGLATQLVEAGHRRFAAVYPSPQEKWHQQWALIQQLSGSRRAVR